MEVDAQAISTVVQERVFARIFETLAADADNEFVMIDATIVASAQRRRPKKDGDNQAIGRSQRQRSTPSSMHSATRSRCR